MHIKKKHPNVNILIRWWKAIHLYGSCDIHGSQLISTLASGCQALPRQLLLQHVSLRFTLLLQSVQQWISAWWTSMDQRLYSLFCCFFVVVFFSSTAYWFHSEVKPEGNQEPFMLPHISASWSNKYQSSMMNCSQHESHCDTMYWFLYDWAHFGVPVWQVVLTDLGANKCDRSVRSCAGQYSSKTHMVFKYEGTGNFMTEPVLHPKFMRLMLGQNRCQSIFLGWHVVSKYSVH